MGGAQKGADPVWEVRGPPFGREWERGNDKGRVTSNPRTESSEELLQSS